MTVKEAIERAIAFANETLDPRRTSSLQLEEVESGQADGKHLWLITLSMTNTSRSFGLLASPDLREYKVFAVSKADGEVVSMKIRETAANNA